VLDRKDGSAKKVQAARAALRRRPAIALAAGCLLAFGGTAFAQSVVIPNFWDPRSRQDRPDLSALRTVRFLTDDDFPPLHFAGPDGNPTGFSVELARAACERLGIVCTIQARRFDTLLDALSEGRGDAIAAAVPITTELRRRFSATSPYFRFPARFVAKSDRNQPEPTPRSIEGHTVGVIERTAHEAYIKTFFSRAVTRPYADLATAEAALRRGEVDYVFGDGLGLAFWIGGSDAGGCCAFTGGQYLESRFFGEGMGFVMRKDDEILRRAFEFALQRLWDEGKYAELYLRFFPVSPF
jgi:polar amino acid transport system substrate-binding protein